MGNQTEKYSCIENIPHLYQMSKAIQNDYKAKNKINYELGKSYVNFVFML